MTSLVAVRCTDGVVVGADSAATFSNGQFKTIEQLTTKKIEIIDGRMIVAGTGAVGLMQRFHSAALAAYGQKALAGKTAIEVGKALSSVGIKDFQQTHLTSFGFSALVAYPAQNGLMLCELDGSAAFQPEIKDPKDIWWVSLGSGQPITDPFLALLRSVYWQSGPPNLQGGIFMALWALRHACEVNPGGIKEPIHMAVLTGAKGDAKARMLEPKELMEQGNIVDDALRHMASFRDILEGRQGASAIPKPATA